MAKLSSTASPPSRQAGAAPSDPTATAPPPGRTTRSMRSQSREPSAQFTEPIVAPATKKRGGEQTRAAQEDLEAVAEHEVDEAQKQEDVAAAEDDAAAVGENIERASPCASLWPQGSSSRSTPNRVQMQTYISNDIPELPGEVDGRPVDRRDRQEIAREDCEREVMPGKYRLKGTLDQANAVRQHAETIVARSGGH
ncbi:hypothetical protein KC365_g16144 [Hortaea werneckii]|nr:hypothetical protein KC339_g18102 [Hortaea werneckii]KAI7208287.1 hypothetical protein KC365_g16144 [Hortaea werneckii]